MDPRTEQAILVIATSHRLFKADTQETPAAYLTRVRLEHAAHLMVVLPDAPRLQVALDSGFRSAATFEP